MLKFKKLISVLMIAFIMLGVVQPVFAASGTGTWVGQQNVFTQQYIWKVIDNADDTFLDADVQAQYESFKADVNNKMAAIERKPSFNNTTIDIKAGETKVIEDTNGELAKYNSINATKDGIRFSHNKGENTMTISVDENVNIENCRISDTTFKEWGLIKEGTEDLDTNLFFEFEDGIQNQLYALNYDDPVALNFSLKIELYGRLELSKETS